MYDYVEIICNVGFPIFVAFYMIVRMDKLQREHTEAINKNTLVMEKLTAKLER